MKIDDTMIRYYKQVNGKIKETKKRDSSSRIWIDVYSPKEGEIEELSKLTKIPVDDFRMALDEDERPRVENNKNYTMIIFRSPFIKDEEIETSSIGIFLTKKYVITIHLYYTGYVRSVFDPARNPPVKSNTLFVWSILSEITKSYFDVLRRIEKQVDVIEDEIIKAPKNVTIEKTGEIKKTLIYFHRSLIANRIVILSIGEKNVNFIDKKYIENFRDLHTEIFQLLEMTLTYKDLLKGSMDSYASIVSNRLGSTVKILTVITALLTIPLLITSVYGMNISLPFENHPYAFSILMVFILLIMAGTWILFRRKNWI